MTRLPTFTLELMALQARKTSLTHTLLMVKHTLTQIQEHPEQSHTLAQNGIERIERAL